MRTYHLWQVPAGDRDTNGKNWRKYHPGDKSFPFRAHQVFLAHRGNRVIKELFFFDNEEDAKWFCTEGYRGMLFRDDEGLTEDVRDP